MVRLRGSLQLLPQVAMFKLSQLKSMAALLRENHPWCELKGHTTEGFEHHKEKEAQVKWPDV